MFAGSYDSLGYDQRKHRSPPQRPRKDYMVTQQERARREKNRRHREQMELMLLGSEEGTCPPMAVRRHCSEPMIHCSNETMMMMRQKHSRHDYHHHDESISLRSSSESLFLRDDDFCNNVTPPTIIYARGVSASQDEMDRDIENHIAPKSSSIAIRYVQPEYTHQQQQHQYDNGQIRSSTYVVLQEKSEVKIEQHKETSSGNETKKDMTEQQPQSTIDMDVHDEDEEDEKIPAPPHLKFNDDMTDDDNDDEETDDFHSLWIHR